VIQGVVGFGFALISVPLVAIIFGPATAVAMNAVVGTANCASKAWFMRKHIERRTVAHFFFATIAFVPVGVAAIVILPERAALATIGIFVIVVSVGNLLSRDRVGRFMRARKTFWAVSAAAGILSGAFSTPGPAAVPYFAARVTNPIVVKANLQFYFTLSAVPVVVFHGVAGTITGVALARAALYLPLVLAGTLVGLNVSRRTPEALLRIMVDGALAALGVWLVVDNLLIV
jgi:uncharacterized membrane protein YfcA